MVNCECGKIRQNELYESNNMKCTSRNQDSSTAIEHHSTQSAAECTHNHKMVYGHGERQSQQHGHRLLFRDIKAVATKKFVDNTRGITHFDILKLVDDPSYTPRQAKNVLRNFKNKGKLYTSRRTKPQEYYLSQDDADYVAQKYRSTHIDPTGVGMGVGSRLVRKYPTTPPSLDSCKNNPNYSDLEYYKAQNAASVIYHTTSGAILVGMHKLHLHLTIGGGNHPVIEEAYRERLAHIPANPKKNKEKLVERRIDNYLVKCSFFPSGAVDIYIPSSDRTFPIYMHDPDATAINIVGFISQIRQFISSPECLNDTRGALVPPIQDPAWQLVDADLNFDVPITTLKFKIMRHFQIVKFGEVFRIYRKLLEGQPYARVEQDKVFKTPLSNKEELGPIIVSAAQLVPQKLFDITTMKAT
jgi:hypothetical protein